MAPILNDLSPPLYSLQGYIYAAYCELTTIEVQVLQVNTTKVYQDLIVSGNTKPRKKEISNLPIP